MLLTVVTRDHNITTCENMGPDGREPNREGKTNFIASKKTPPPHASTRWLCRGVDSKDVDLELGRGSYRCPAAAQGIPAEYGQRPRRSRSLHHFVGESLEVFGLGNRRDDRVIG
jgi:hypothetical protein